MGAHRLAGCDVTMGITLVCPGIVVPGEALTGQTTGFLTVVESLELAPHLGASSDEHTVIDSDDLLCNRHYLSIHYIYHYTRQLHNILSFKNQLRNHYWLLIDHWDILIDAKYPMRSLVD